jgi:predicted DNA-binding transcriptional regulator AlpA
MTNVILSSVSIPDLVEMIADKVQSRLLPQPTTPDRLLSPNETAKMFDVDLSTLYRWDKLGYLTKIKIGGKVRYRMSDIQKLLKHE